MAKYSFEFKVKVVNEYLNGEGSYPELCRRHNIPDHKQLRRWVATYKTFGANGLIRSRKNKTYTYEFKLHVVELYLTTEMSYQDIALQVGITNPPIVCKWVNDYREVGPDALKPKRKGRPAQMNKTNSTKPDKESAKVTDAEELKRLQEENLRLRIENAYLKEKRRLRLEKITPKKKRE